MLASTFNKCDNAFIETENTMNHIKHVKYSFKGNLAALFYTEKDLFVYMNGVWY